MVCGYKSCTNEFEVKKGKKYCSRRCKQKAYRLRADPEKFARFVKFRDRFKIYRKDKCERCGFVPEHIGQLDLDHIDGNSKNNDPMNFQTLCANCHRLKTMINKDNLKR